MQFVDWFKVTYIKDFEIDLLDKDAFPSWILKERTNIIHNDPKPFMFELQPIEFTSSRPFMSGEIHPTSIRILNIDLRNLPYRHYTSILEFLKTSRGVLHFKAVVWDSAKHDVLDIHIVKVENGTVDITRY
jgi:hypothetical protein